MKISPTRLFSLVSTQSFRSVYNVHITASIFPSLTTHHTLHFHSFSSIPLLFLIILSPTTCLQSGHTNSLPHLSALSTLHQWLLFPMFPYLHNWLFERAKLVTLLLSLVGSLQFSDKSQWNWWLCFHIPFCFYTILHFYKPLTSLAACFMLVLCLAYSLTLRMGVTWLSEMSTDF
jgi:hypothetical protein